MRKSFVSKLLLALFCLVSVGCTEKPQYKSVQFGAFSEAGGKVTFQAKTQVSKSQETIVGWAFDIENPPKQIIVREVISGPRGTSWPPGPGEITNEGRTVSVIKTFQNPGSTFLFHNWTIDQSNAAGDYKATLYIDDQLVKELDFAVSN